MKIVLTAHQFLPDFKAGTEILTYETAKELTGRGHDVEIWTGFPADPVIAAKCSFDSYRYKGIQVHRYYQSFQLPGVNPMEIEYCNSVFSERFGKYLEEKKPDLVHFFHLMRLSASAIDVVKKHRISAFYTPTDFWAICPMCQLWLPSGKMCLGPDPNSVNCLRHLVQMTKPPAISNIVSILPEWFIELIITCSDKKWWPEKKISPQLLSLSRRLIFIRKRLNQLDKILVPTRFMEKMLVGKGIDPTKTYFIPFGLNLDHFQELKEKSKSESLRIGFIGTLFEHKGVHVLLEAIKMIDEHMPLEVKVYGRLDEFPDYVESLKNLVGSDSRIKFPGTFPNDRIGEIFSEIDVLVVPSIWYENTPLVIYSAFASRTPVIASDLGGMSEVVHHEENGLLFEKGDFKELAKLISRLLDDRSLLAKLTENIVPPTSIPEYVDALEMVYAEDIEKRKSG